MMFDGFRIFLLTLVGVVVGWAVDRLWHYVTGLRKRGEAQRPLRRATRAMLPLWGGLLGCHAGLLFFPLAPQAFVILDRVLFMVLVLSLCVVASRVASGWLERHAPRMVGETRSVSILTIMGRTLIYTVGALVVLNHLGVSIAPMITALGIGGLAVALALQDTLTNLFAGLQLLASDQVNVGDFVKLEDGSEGYVMDITWRNTTIRALSNHLIVVPNGKLAASVIVNECLPDPSVAVLVEVAVGYDSDLAHVERVTVETARKVMRQEQPGLPGFEPFIRYHTFGDSGIGLSVIMRVREFTERYVLMHAFIMALHKCYNEVGITIPYPVRTVRMEIPQHATHE